METSTRRPVLHGIAASILAAPTALFFYSAISEYLQGHLDLVGLAVGATAIYYFGVMISGPLGLAAGLPYTLWLKRRGRLSWFSACSAATLAGLLAFVGIWFLSFQSYMPLVSFAFLGVLAGLLSGIAFCAVVRPNNSFKPTPHRGVGHVPALR